LAGLGHASKFNGFRVLASLFSRFDQQHSTQGALQLCISERERELYNAVARPSVGCRLSVCRLSVTLVHPPQAVEMFGNISMALGISLPWPSVHIH